MEALMGQGQSHNERGAARLLPRAPLRYLLRLAVVDGVLEALARLECGSLGRGDLHLLAGLGVASRTSGAVTDLEGAKAGQGDLLAALQSRRDGVEDCVECLGGFALGKAGTLRGGLGELT